LWGFSGYSPASNSRPKRRRLRPLCRLGTKALGYVWIRANIRADNDGGLTYYQSRGFRDYGVIEDYKLADGTLVNKTLKRYDV